MRTCPFCHENHDVMIDCEPMKKSLARMRAKMDAYKKEKLDEEHEWPIQEHVVKLWKAHGFPCAVCRGMVALCGYVQVPKGHPAYGKWYDDVDVDVHGGLTFAQRTKDGHWLGFDCGHFGDWWGTVENGHGFEHPGKIWTVEDVVQETENLARQFAEMAVAGANDTRKESQDGQ